MNPGDVFPRRNLPGGAEEWGREVENRIRDVEYAAFGQKQGLNGQNRTSAANAQELSRQLIQLRDFAEDLEDLYEELADLYDAIPKVDQVTAVQTGFGLNAGWNVILTASVTVPPGVSEMSLLVNGSGLLVSTSTTSVITSRSRLNVSGEYSPAAPNAWYPGQGAFGSIMVPSWSRTLAVTPGSTVSVDFEAEADDHTSYGYNTASYAVLSVIATFTG